MENTTKKKRYFPSSFTIIIGLMLLFIIISWIGHAATSEIHGLGMLDIFPAIWKGFVGKADVILFIFAVGGILGIMTKLQVIDSGINALVHKLGNKVWLLIPTLMFIFGLGGTSYGMWEETIAFIPILIPVFRKAKYGSFTAIMVILLGAGTGVLASTVNPFAVGSAVSAFAGSTGDPGPIPTATTAMGQGSRWLAFIVFEIVAIAMVTWMARGYRKSIIAGYKTQKKADAAATGNMFKKFFTKGIVAEGVRHDIIEKRFKEKDKIPFTAKRKISLGIFIFAFLLMILMYLPWGDILGAKGLASAQHDYMKSMWWFASTKMYAPLGEWYFISVAALFLFATIGIFAINFKEFKTDKDNAEQTFINTYMTGVKDVISVCLLIAVAGGLGEILKSSGIGEWIAKKSANGLKNWVAFGVVIFFVSIILSFLVPSTSGFATAFVPVFAKIGIAAFPGNDSAVVGIIMMAFLFASGIANFITPTSAALMGYTQYAGIPYNTWLKQTWKYILVISIIAFVIVLGFSISMQNGGTIF